MPSDIERLAPLGADERVATLLRSALEPSHVPARIVRVDRDRCLAAGPVGVEPARGSPLPAVGDWVGLDPGDPESGAPATVAVVGERFSALRRGGQIVAANLDIVFVVTGLDREPNLNRLERELVLAWDSGARPVLVLNKTDHVEDPEGVAEVIRARLGAIDILLANGLSGDGVAGLADRLAPGVTGVLVGASGVGKTTLFNRLVDGPAARVGAVRASDRRGRHTTTARSLVTLAGGGVLIDTPGVASLELGDAEEGIALSFPEIGQLASQCRFRDCAHHAEPGCAVLAAIDAGELGPARFASWQKLRRELPGGERP